MTLRYTKTYEELITRWAAGLITEPTGTETFFATEAGIFSGIKPEEKPPLGLALAIWADGERGKVAFLKTYTTSECLHHQHRNLVGWNLHRCGIRVIEVADFDRDEAVKWLERKIMACKDKTKHAKTTGVPQTQERWHRKCLQGTLKYGRKRKR